MAESNEIFKIAVFIGLVLFFASMLASPWVYVGQPIPPDSAWGQFSAAAGSFPAFVAPNGAGQVATISPVADYCTGPGCPAVAHGYQTFNNVGSAHMPGCVNGTSPSDLPGWGCVASPDSNGSAVRLYQPVAGAYYVNVSDPPSASNQLVLSYSVTVQCAVLSGTVSGVAIAVNQNTANPLVPTVLLFPTDPTKNVCGLGGQWNTFTYTWDLSGRNWTVAKFTGDSIAFSLVTSGQDVAISYVSAQIVTSNQQLCGTGLDGIACGFQNFGWSVVNFFVTIGTGLLFFFQILFWFVSLIGVFFSALGTLFLGSGSPPLVTGLLGVLILGLIIFVALVGMGKIRGTGNVG